MKKILTSAFRFCSARSNATKGKIPQFANLPKIRKTIRLDYLKDANPEEITGKPTKSLFGKALSDVYFSKHSYLLAGELFSYLHKNYEKLIKEFPIVKENITEIMPNLMALHVVMAIERLMDEKTVESRKEISTFLFYVQTYHFVPFARLCNDHLEPEDFADIYIEGYSNRIDMILQKLLEYGEESESEDRLRKIKRMLRSHVFLNIIKEEHPTIDKLLKYYMAHRYYLFSLKYEDILDYQVYWGLLGAPIQLAHEGK